MNTLITDVAEGNIYNEKEMCLREFSLEEVDISEKYQIYPDKTGYYYVLQKVAKANSDLNTKNKRQ